MQCENLSIEQTSAYLKSIKGKRDKGKGLIGSPCETATENVELDAWGAVPAARGTAVVGEVAPPPAAQDARPNLSFDSCLSC